MMSSRMASTPICRSCWSVLQAYVTRISLCLELTCKQLPLAGGTGGDAHVGTGKVREVEQSQL